MNKKQLLERMPRFARKEVRDVAHQLAAMGATYEGWTNNGHYVFNCNGTTVILPSTPKGNGWKPRVLRAAYKAFGVKPPAPKKNLKFRGRRTGFSMPTGVQTPEWQERDREEFEALRTELFNLGADGPSRKNVQRGAEVIRQLAAIQRRLQKVYAPPPEGGWLPLSDEGSVT